MAKRSTFAAVAPHLARAALDTLRDPLAYQLGITPTDAPMIDDLFDVLGGLLEGEMTLADVKRLLPGWRPEPGSLAYGIAKIIELADAAGVTPARVEVTPARVGGHPCEGAPLVEAVSDDAQAVYIDGLQLRLEIRDGQIVVDAGDRQAITEKLRRGTACSRALHQITVVAEAPEDYCAGVGSLPEQPLDDDEQPDDVLASVAKLAKDYITSQRMSSIARLRVAN